MTWIAAGLLERRAQFGRFLLGTGGFGGVSGTVVPGHGLSEEDGLSIIDRAVAEGLTVIDTADVYTEGASERVIGTWNRSHPGSGVLIQGKTGSTAAGPDLSPERVSRQLKRSIGVLGRVDLYAAHQPDPATPWADSLPVFSAAVEDGTIRAYGLSNVDASDLASALETADRLGLVRPEIVQNSYSLLVRHDDQDVLPIVQSEGLAYTPYSPLATGVLAGRYSRGERPGIGNRASRYSPAEGFLNDPGVMIKVHAFDRLAAECAVTPAGLALAWLVNHPLVTAPIVAPTKQAHWQGIAEATELDWTEVLAGKLEAIFAAA